MKIINIEEVDKMYNIVIEDEKLSKVYSILRGNTRNLSNRVMP